MGLNHHNLRIKLEWMRSCFLWMSQWLLEMEPTYCEDAVKLVEMTTKDLKYSPNLVDETAVGFERTDSNSERGPTEGKMLSNSIPR